MQTVVFPAIIGLSYPESDRLAVNPGFPRAYDWTDPTGVMTMPDKLWAVNSPISAHALFSGYGRAINWLETGEARVEEGNETAQRIIPVGTPVLMCYGRPRNQNVNLPEDTLSPHLIEHIPEPIILIGIPMFFFEQHIDRKIILCEDI